MRMDDNRLPRQAVHWDISGTKRTPRRLGKELDRHHTTRFEKHRHRRHDLGSSAITCNFHAYVLTDKSELAASLTSSSHCRISIRHDASDSKSNFAVVWPWPLGTEDRSSRVVSVAGLWARARGFERRQKWRAKKYIKFVNICHV